MAIVESVPGVEVTIVADGQPLHEYTDPDNPEEEDDVTRRIEAVSEQIFEIHVNFKKKVPMKSDCITTCIYVDGKVVARPMALSAKTRHRDLQLVSKGIELPGDMIRRYRFSGLELAKDRRAFHGEADQLKDLGSIKIEVFHERKLRKVLRRYLSEAETGIVSEKALKGRALSHSVGFGPAVEHANAPKSWETEHVDPTKQAAGTYTFLYSSRAALQYMLIIPRTPTPPPLEDIDNPTADQVKQLQAQMRAMKAKQEASVKIKQEAVERGKRQRADDSQSPHRRPRKTARVHQGDALMEEDEHGNLRSTSTAGLPAPEKVVISIDSDSDEDGTP